MKSTMKYVEKKNIRVQKKSDPEPTVHRAVLTSESSAISQMPAEAAGS